MRSRYVPLSLCLPRFLPSRLFLLPKRHLRNQFRCRPATLGLSFGIWPTKIFFLHERERAPSPILPVPPKFRNIITLSPKRFPLSLLRASKIPREYTPQGDGGCRFRESSFTNFVTRAEGTRCRLALHLYSLRKVRSRPRSLNSIICGISSATSTLSPLFSTLPSRVGLNRRDRRCIDKFYVRRRNVASRNSRKNGIVDLPQKSPLVLPRGV